MEKEPIRVLQIMGIVGSGGVESVIMNYYSHIDKSKVQFDFVMHKGGNPKYIAEIKRMGGRVYEITPYTKNIIRFTYEIYKIIKDGNYDIVHSNMNSLSGFPLMAACFAGAKIRILHNHTTDTKAEGIRTLVKRILRPLAKLFANEYWACSRLAGEWMYGKDALEQGKVTIINNAIDLDKFAFNQEKRDKIREKLGLSDKFVIGHVGRFMKQKNHDFLIDVFNEVQKKNKESVLLLIGEGPLKEQISDKVNSLGLTDKVLFLGVRNDVADLYNAMDVFVLPSFYEGLPVVGVEVQANSLPFVCSDNVTRELDISNNIDFVSINSDIYIWATKVLVKKTEYCNIRSYSDIESKFDIHEASLSLENDYCKFNCEVHS